MKTNKSKKQRALEAFIEKETAENNAEKIYKNTITETGNGEVFDDNLNNNEELIEFIDIVEDYEKNESGVGSGENENLSSASTQVPHTENNPELVNKTDDKPRKKTKRKKQKAKVDDGEIRVNKNAYSCFFKRFFDIFLSGLALILLSPVMLIVAILIRIKLGGPVLFVQWRLGKNNRPFKFYKFRSMRNSYDKDGNLLPDVQRITKFGTALRKTSLDELPQLWNIFIGNMSIIGPRPRMIEECVFLDSSSLSARGLVRPGLTGLAQINGRNNITFDKVVEYDKTYVETVSLGKDLKIFFKTIGKVFKKSDVNKKGTVSNEFYGDMLLRTGAISQEEYDAKQAEAKEIIKKAG